MSWMLAKALTTPATPDRSAEFSGDSDHLGASGDPRFEERLTREITQSERTRMLILAGLSGSLVVVFPALVLVFRQNDARIFRTAWALQVVAVLVLLAGYELAIRQVVGRRLEQGKTLPRWLRFWNAFVETSVPSILILIDSRHVDPVYSLQSAAAYLYPVFIVLSTLRLDFRLSVFTGCVAAAEYVLLSAVFVRGSEVAAGTLFSLLPFYLAKGVMLVVAGFAAGFVADEIKRRVTSVFLGLEERQRIVSAFGQQVSPAIVEERIEQLNKDYGSQLLVSAEVLREAGEGDHGAESLGMVHVKGHDEPIEIYRLA